MLEVLLYVFQFAFLSEILIYLGLTFIPVLLKYPKKELFNTFYENAEIWKNYPIYKFSYSETIPKDYEEYSFFDWPGSKSGCNCLEIKEFNQLYSESCNSNKKNEGCKNVNEQKPRKISKFNSKIFSVIYYKENYFSLLSRTIENGKNCKNGYKKCSYLDTKKNVFCIKEDEICSPNLELINQNEKNFNNTDSYLLNRLVFSQKQFPCLSQIKSLIYDNLILYNHYDGKYSISECRDSNFQSINYIGKKINLYKENGINYSGIDFSNYDSNIYLLNVIYTGLSSDYFFYSSDFFIINHHNFHFYFTNLLKLITSILFFKFNIWSFFCSFDIHSKKKEQLNAIVIGIILFISYFYIFIINDSFYRVFIYFESLDYILNISKTINLCYFFDIINGLIGILFCVLFYLFPTGTDEPKSEIIINSENEISYQDSDLNLIGTPNSNLITNPENSNSNLYPKIGDSNSNLYPKPQDETPISNSNSNIDPNLDAPPAPY